MIMSKTTIILEKTTRERLKQCGVKGQSYDDVMQELVYERTNMPNGILRSIS